jgi:hypothetical protein
MELVAAERKQAKPEEKLFVAIVNCGFPEALHTQTCLAICRRFASETGLKWAGGLGLGGGEAVAGRALQQAGGLVRNVKRSLKLTSESLAEGGTVPQRAVELMAKPLIPSWLYRWIGHRRWKSAAKHHGVQDKLLDRPFL